jgi:hypothetical protein
VASLRERKRREKGAVAEEGKSMSWSRKEGSAHLGHLDACRIGLARSLNRVRLCSLASEAGMCSLFVPA